MEEMTEKELSKIEELAKPLVEFVRETKKPYVEIQISAESVKIKTVTGYIPIKSDEHN